MPFSLSVVLGRVFLRGQSFGYQITRLRSGLSAYVLEGFRFRVCLPGRKHDVPQRRKNRGIRLDYGEGIASDDFEQA